jgi:transposase-like protein
MRYTPGLLQIILLLALLVTLAQGCEGLGPIWDERTALPRRLSPGRNPKRNRERWARRWARRPCRRVRSKSRRGGTYRVRQWQRAHGLSTGLATARRWNKPRVSVSQSRPTAMGAYLPPRVQREETDPLAKLRRSRGLIDYMAEHELWAMLRKVRWPYGPVCPHCGEEDPRYLKVLDANYRGGLGRWQCLVCAGAGDPGEGGTFTPLTGTILDGMRIDIGTLWLIVEAFAQGMASVESSEEARVNRHTTDRLFRLLRAAIYETRSTKPIALEADQIVEMDEVYITAGLKGCAGGLELEREPRRRGLKRRGRGTWDSDRLPVFGLLCRGGEARLFVLRNVQTATIRPIVEQMVQKGARVYTDSYSIYHFLSREGYQHQAVNHGAGEYALDLNGDGKCEVHCNTVECTWSWLRQMIRTYRGVSKVYLPLYVAQFEFLFNRRQHNRWNRTLDVLQAAFAVPADSVTDLLDRVSSAQFAEVCPVAG